MMSAFLSRPGARLGAAAAISAFLLGGGVDRAAADFVVLASSSDAYERGALLANDDALVLKDGARLRLMSPSGDTREIYGPLSIDVGALEGARDPVSEGFERVVAYFGAERDETQTAATRDATARFVIMGTPVGPEGGVYCYASAAEVTLAPREGAGGGRATVSGPTGVGHVAFDASGGAAPWPSPVRSGQEYAVSLTPGGSATVTLTRLDPRAARDPQRRLAALAERGCFAQFEAALNADAPADAD